MRFEFISEIEKDICIYMYIYIYINACDCSNIPHIIVHVSCYLYPHSCHQTSSPQAQLTWVLWVSYQVLLLIIFKIALPFFSGAIDVSLFFTIIYIIIICRYPSIDF